MTPQTPSSAPAPWRRQESLVVAGIVAIFVLAGAAQYRERRAISATEQFRADLRMLALAINTYRTDQGVYPPPGIDTHEAASRFTGRLPAALSTPIAYINRLPTDPYAADGTDHALLYFRRETSDKEHGDPDFDALVVHYLGEPASDVDYAVVSLGPDGDLDLGFGPDGSPQGIAYDPTNGARSNGDIIYWGPAIGARRNPYAGTVAAGRGGLQ